MRYNIDLHNIEEWKKQIMIKATIIRSNLKDWSCFHDKGRIYVGWKRVAYGQQQFRFIYFKPLTAHEILKRKVKRWVKRLT